MTEGYKEGEQRGEEREDEEKRREAAASSPCRFLQSPCFAEVLPLTYISVRELASERTRGISARTKPRSISAHPEKEKRMRTRARGREEGK